uniref:Lin-28 homolog Aa n=1 Tax=Oryzias melastigma TaxID=30732 RepID=A0A3B3DXK6_ORYME
MAPSFHGVGVCKWFNVRMGFGFLSMTKREGVPLDEPVDVFVHQSKLHMEGFRSLKEGEAVEFTYKKSSKGLESQRVTGPGGIYCVGSERRPKAGGSDGIGGGCVRVQRSLLQLSYTKGTTSTCLPIGAEVGNFCHVLV